MGTFQLRLLSVWLIVLCSIVAVANGGTSRGGSFKTSFTFRSSSSDDSSSYTPGEAIGIGCGILGALIAIVVIGVIIRCCRKRNPSTAVPGQIISYGYQNSVTGLPPTYADAVSNHPENSAVTTPQPDQTKVWTVTTPPARPARVPAF